MPINFDVPKNPEPELLTVPQAAARMAMKPSTLALWLRQGRGPRAIRVGDRWTRFRACDLNEWLNANTVASTQRESAMARPQVRRSGDAPTPRAKKSATTA